MNIRATPGLCLILITRPSTCLYRTEIERDGGSKEDLHWVRTPQHSLPIHSRIDDFIEGTVLPVEDHHQHVEGSDHHQHVEGSLLQQSPLVRVRTRADFTLNTIHVQRRINAEHGA
ncbi:hypothetical protein OF83DRAFT_820864 [Amylostereum chailletii]|nr:hypothetical protein OF83DRAFT_820864 [Amylostereum chailletii]